MGLTLPDPKRSGLYRVEFSTPREVWPIWGRVYQTQRCLGYMGLSLPDPERSGLYGIEFIRPREVLPIWV